MLNDGDDLMVENSSFRLYKQEMHTVKQKKSAYNQIYVKRKVLDDGIGTEPLDIVLRSYKKLTRGLELEIPENPVEFNPVAEAITNSQDEARVRVELGMGQLEDYDIYDSDQDLSDRVSAWKSRFGSLVHSYYKISLMFRKQLSLEIPFYV